MVTTAFIIVYIYFKHVMKIVDRRCIRMLNYVALYAGFTSAYGLMMVGSFQVTSFECLNVCYIVVKKEQNRTV